MTHPAPVRVLLGPQTPVLNVAEAIAGTVRPEGRVAVISAGWQEAEGDLGELCVQVGRPLEDVRLYHRVEEIFHRDQQLTEAYRSRQDKLMDQQRLYRLRLKQLAIAARHTMGAEGDAEMLAAEQRHAIAQLRALDRHHLHRTESIHRTFEDAFNETSHALLATHCREVGDIIESCDAVLITGGNIAVLLNRMRLFGIGKLLRDRHIIAWSAGAMVLADRIVLFHDRTPQGRRDSEVLGAGCGLVPGYVFLPDTSRRLRVHDHLRAGLMCRRFSPDVCIGLDSGAELHFADSAIAGASSVKRLGHDGRFAKLRVA